MRDNEMVATPILHMPRDDFGFSACLLPFRFRHKLPVYAERSSSKKQYLMKVYNDILGLIGKTPLVQVNHITKQHKIKAKILAKTESLNPGYSVKDRIGISM